MTTEGGSADPRKDGSGPVIDLDASDIHHDDPHPSEAEPVASDAPRNETAAPAADASPPSRNGSKAPPVLASGIIGGLVALALAGAMQYAGVLPALGPAQGGSAQPSTAALKGLQGDIDLLKSQIASLPRDGKLPAATEDRLKALETALASGGASGAGNGAADSKALADLTARLDALTSANQALKDRVASLSASSPDLAALTDRLDKAEKKLAEPPAQTAVAAAIAAASLKSATERGGPFLGELQTLAGVLPADPSIAVLKPFAPAGVATRAEVSAAFSAKADQMLAAAADDKPASGILERLMNSAGKLVTVRPVGNVVGQDPAAIIARIETKLKNADLKGAALEWDNLPSAAKSAGQDVRKMLEDRQTLDEAISSLMTRTVAAAARG